MNKLFRLIFSLALIFQPLLNDVGAVTVQFPTALDNSTSLYDVKNNQQTNLDEALDATETAITVDSTSGFPTNGTIQIDNELIYYSSKNAITFVGCTRGYDGTSNTTHLDNTEVNHSIVADHINIKRDAIIAIETELGLEPKGSDSSVVDRLDRMQSEIDVSLTQNEVITLSGDATGSGRTAITVEVVDDSHAHMGTSVSGLAVADFTSSAVSQWFNDSGFITGNETITITGDGSGSGTTSIDLAVVDDSHNHTASSVSDLSPSDFTTTIVSQWFNDAGYVTNADVSITSGQVTDFDSAVTALVEGYGYLTDVTEEDLNLSDTTLANSSASEHGLLPKLENSGTKYLRDDGTWQTISTNPVLAGDCTGTYDSNTVEAIQGVDISTTVPTNAQVLKYNSGTSKWEPAADSSSSGGIATVQEVDVTVTDNASVLNFQEGFDVTETPAGTVEVTFDLTEKQVNLTTEVTGILPTANGGTGLDAATTGDIIIATGTDTWDQLAAGTASYVLTSNGANTAPSWQEASGGITNNEYIRGFQLSYVSGTAFNVDGGEAYIKSASSVLTNASTINVSGLSLTGTSWYYVYLYDSGGGTAAIDVSTTAPTMNGQYYSYKTGATGYRTIGALLTDSTGTIIKFQNEADGNFSKFNYIKEGGSSPLRVVSAGTSTTVTTVSLATVVPDVIYANYEVVAVMSLAAGGDMNFGIGCDYDSGATYKDTSMELYARFRNDHTSGVYYFLPAKNIKLTARSFYYIMANNSGSNSIYIDSRGYTIKR